VNATAAAEKNFKDKSPSMLAALYGKKQLDLRTLVPNHLTEYHQEDLYQLLSKYKSIFDGDLGTLLGKLVQEEVNRLCGLKVLQCVNESGWGAPSFGIPKKNSEIRFVSGFHQLNKVLRRKPYPLPVPHEYLCSLDGFSYCTSMDLKIGFCAIHLSLYYQKLCTIVLPVA
jgi:hypothetical protein